jgi:hypothetical protein
MKTLWRTAASALAVFALTFGNASGVCQTLEDIQRIAPVQIFDGIFGYIYGYPLVIYGATGRIGNNVPDATTKLGGAPLNQFGKETVLPNASFTAVVLPSTSTLYASSFLNLCQEPIILHVPDTHGRFFLLQMLDGWTEVSAQSPGSRPGSAPGDYALVGPDCGQYKQPLIPGNGFIDVIRMPTSNMWIIGRIYTNGSDSDIADVVNNIYPGLTLTPWSKYTPGGTYTPPDHLSTQAFGDVITAPVRQLNGMDACSFFGNLASMLIYNPPVPGQDDAAVRSLKRIGVVPGQAFDCTTLSADRLANLQQGLQLGKNILDLQVATRPTTTNWTVSLDVGNYGAHYLLRAEVAENALGANRPVDAVYGYTTIDSSGANLDGSKKYVIHFLKPGVDQGIPPVNPNAFWSLTIYDGAGKLVPSPDPVNANWNAVGEPYVQNHHACYNSDKSLDVYLQSTEPTDPMQKCNWIPTPTSGGFIAFLRLYWPDQVVLDKGWIPPAILKNGR